MKCSSTGLLLLTAALSLITMLFALSAHYEAIGVDNAIDFRIGVWNACCGSSCSSAKDWIYFIYTLKNQTHADWFKDFIIEGFLAIFCINTGAVTSLIHFTMLLLQAMGCMDFVSGGGIIWSKIVGKLTVIFMTAGCAIMTHDYYLFVRRKFSQPMTGREQVIDAIAWDRVETSGIQEPRVGISFVLPWLAVITSLGVLFLAHVIPFFVEPKRREFRKQDKEQGASLVENMDPIFNLEPPKPTFDYQKL